MVQLVIICFLVTLMYMSITERFKVFARLIGLQGVCLFIIALLDLDQKNWLNLSFIVLETLLIKTLLIPFLLFRIIKANKIYKVHQFAMPDFINVIINALGLIICVLLSISLSDGRIDTLYFMSSLFALYTGLVLVITQKKIFSHLIGFLVIENSVFLFSLAVGNVLPMVLNFALVLDIFVSILILGMFLRKIGEMFHQFDSEELTNLRD